MCCFNTFEDEKASENKELVLEQAVVAGLVVVACRSGAAGGQGV